MQDAREAARRRRLGGGVEEEVDDPAVEGGALADLDGEEERGLALVDALERVEVTRLPLREARQLVAELEQQLELEVVARRAEVVGDLGQGRGQRGVAHRGQRSMGTRTELPHSVHEPS